MKRIIFIIALMALLCQFLNSQSASITDFLQPVSSAQRLFCTLNMDYSGTDTMSAKGLLNLTYTKYYSSLPFSYSITGFLYINYANLQQGSTNIYQDNGQFSPQIHADIQKYLSDKSDFFIAGNSSISYQKPFEYKDGYLQTLIGPGVGYGRIVVATAMAQALRIEEYLLSEKLISGEFSKEITIEIASHCSKLNEYATKYGDKHPIDWYMDLEKILVKSGKLVDNRISPYSLFRIQEVLNRERVYDRKIGWRVTGYLNYEFNADIPKQNNGSSVDEYAAILRLEIGYPLSNRLQFNHYTNYTYDNTFKYPAANNRIYSTTSLAYKFTNLFDFLLTYRLDFNAVNGITYTINRYQTFSFNLYYYVENNIFLQLVAGLQNNLVSGYQNYYPNPNTNTLNKSITLNIGYRFF